MEYEEYKPGLSWTQFVSKYARNNGLSYNQALLEARSQYHLYKAEEAKISNRQDDHQQYIKPEKQKKIKKVKKVDNDYQQYQQYLQWQKMTQMNAKPKKSKKIKKIEYISSESEESD
jgi:hypothetical protein